VRRATALLVVLVLGFGPQSMSLAVGPTGNVVLRGAVVLAENGNAVAGATVYAVHLDTKQVFKSTASGANGEYQITGLPFGYYDLAVETTDGLYLANRVVNAPAGEKVEISLLLGPPQPEDTEWWSAEPDRRIPGLDRVPDGVARIVEGKPRRAAIAAAAPGATTTAAAATAGGSNWLIPALVAAGVIALAVIADDDDKETDESATPF